MLPRSLGNFKGAPLLTDRLCSQCNNDLGQLDEQLVRSGGEAFFRNMLGIVGGGGEEVSSFYRGSSGGGRVVISGERSDGQRIDQDPSGKELRQIRIQKEDGGIEVIPIPANMTRDRLLNEIRRRGILTAPSAWIECQPNERDFLEGLISGLSENETQWFETPGGRRYTNVRIEFSVTDRYFRAYAKIGFHYFLARMTQYSGAEPLFADLRRYIKSGEGARSQLGEPFVQVRDEPIATEMVLGLKLPEWGHIIAAESVNGELRSRVQLFVGPEYPSLTFAIQVGLYPSIVPHLIAEASWFRYLPEESRKEWDGEVNDLRPLVVPTHLWRPADRALFPYALRDWSKEE